MVGRPGKYQPRFTSGELDELIQQNTDLKIYGTGASRFANVMPIPQGGFRTRYGSIKRCRLATTPQPVPYDPARWTVTAPLGGSASGPVQSPATALVVPITGSGNVIWRVDLGSAANRNVVMLDILAAYTATALTGASLYVDYSFDNVNWTTIGLHPVSADPKSRRYAMAPPVNGARFFRIIYAGTSTQLTIGAIQLFSNTGAISTKVRIKPFNLSITESYDVVFTDFQATIYRQGVQMGVVPTPYAGDTIAELNVKQSLDTMLVFHDAYPPLRIMHQAGPTEWNWDNAPFTKVPLADYGLDYTNAIPASWDLQFFGFETGSTAYPLPSGGAHFQLTVNNQTTGLIQYPWTVASYATVCGLIKAAVEALPNVEPGVTVSYLGGGTSAGSANSTLFRLSFAGKGNEGDAWAVSGQGVDKGDTAITAQHSVQGVKGGEAIMSAARGWPACGAFFAGRLILGGFAGKPNTVVASVALDYFNLDNSIHGSNAAMVLPLDTQGAEQIIELHVGHNLLIFTNEAEYYLYDAALDATVVPQVKLASRNGIARGVAPIENEAQTIYIHRNRGRMFEYAFSYEAQTYLSSDMSVQSSSLVKGVIDNALRKSTDINDANTLFVAKADGTMLAVTLLRGQSVTAFARLIFEDAVVLCVDVNGAFEVNVCTQRLVAGQAIQFLETNTTSTFLDQAETHTLSPPGKVVTGLDDLEAATVWANADGYWEGPYTVAGGQITLGFEATNVMVGRWAAPDARTLPQPRDVAPHTVVRRPARVHTVRCTVVDTTSIAIGANDQPAIDVPLKRWGRTVDEPMEDTPYTGEVCVEGLLGYSKDAIVQITQTKPGALTVTGVTVEVDL